VALEFARTSKYCELKWEGVECSPNSGIPKKPNFITQHAKARCGAGKPVPGGDRDDDGSAAATPEKPAPPPTIADRLKERSWHTTAGVELQPWEIKFALPSLLLRDYFESPGSSLAGASSQTVFPFNC